MSYTIYFFLNKDLNVDFIRILMLIIGFSSGGDCGMFLIKYAKYLIHDHSFNSLISAHVD